MDHIIQRLQTMPSFNIYQVQEDGTVVPWYEVTGAVIGDLVISEANLTQQVELVAAQVMHWGRLASQAKRVWEIEERALRVWKNQQILEAITPPSDGRAWKKPTQQAIEAEYRTHPMYVKLSEASERAEEAYNAAQAVLDGFRAQRDMLKAAVVKTANDSAPRLSV